MKVFIFCHDSCFVVSRFMYLLFLRSFMNELVWLADQLSYPWKKQMIDEV